MDLQAARARQVQEAQLEQLQRDMAAAMLAAKEHNSSAAGLAQQKVGQRLGPVMDTDLVVIGHKVLL